MKLASVYTQINELAKNHGIENVDEIFKTVKMPKMVYRDNPDTVNPSRAIAEISEKIKAAGFEYYFEAETEEEKQAIAIRLVRYYSQIKNIIEID